MDNSITVPFAPPGVCFKREQFIHNDFSADVFLQDLWHKVPLEVLRDDLGSYLKVLRSAMIELINRDYADFVNLSGNLVGLDKAISNLEEPLSVIHSEISSVEKILDDEHNKLLLSLSEAQSLREKKLALECLMKIPISLDHLEKLLVNISTPETISKMIEDSSSKGSVMERAANEFNQLQHLVVKCGNSSTVLIEFTQRIDEVNLGLMKCLEDTLMYGIEQQNKDVVYKTLRTFILLDQSKFAVNLIRIRLIHPAFEKILNQNQLKMEPQDLHGLLNKIKAFMKEKIKDLIDISGRFEGARGLNLVVNCLWPEFYNCLVANLDVIFSQGNPDLFHKRFSSTVGFLDYLESLSNYSSSHSLENDPNYQLLISRWNLPVYFQMRYQELAGNLEKSLVKPFNEAADGDETRGNLNCTNVLLNSLVACFSPEIYLSQLAHRFWKLCLQLISRYQKKILEMLLEQLKRHETTTSSASLTQSASSTKLAELETSMVLNTENLITLQQLVKLDSDVSLVIKELPNVWNVAWKHLEVFGANNRSVFQSAFNASGDKFQNLLLPKINQLIIAELSSQCTSHLRQVIDIPRLYRRTNKETPTKCFNYVHQLLAAIIEFKTQHAGRNGRVEQWTQGALEILAQQYLVAVSDVLTSVQKTEESLRRLRKDRAASTSVGVSDDDKIRMQLIIDVDAFIAAGKPILLETSKETLPLHLQALLDVVEPARSVLRRSPIT